MVKMIPATYDDEKTSIGEKMVFNALRQIEGRPSWIVIHSLKQARSVRRLESETDFVILAPGKGILLIEVKGATKVSINGNKFEMFLDDKLITKNPLDQLSRGSANIRKYLKEQKFSGYELPISRMVWFNRLSESDLTEYTPDQGMELHDWELAWSTDLGHPELTIIENLDAFVFAHLNFDDEKYNQNLLTPEMAEAIAESLRVKLENETTLLSEASYRSTLVKQATADQVRCLDNVSSNRQIYFNGGAGSGKTQILIRAAKQLAAQGKSVLVTAWTEKLAADLKASLKDIPNIFVGAVSQIFAQLTDAVEISDDRDVWFDRQLPELALQAIRADIEFAKFDALCVDEFQDIASKPPVLETLRAMLQSDGSRVVLVGDDRQQIMNFGEPVVSIDSARLFWTNTVTFDLNTNCRQAPALSRKVHEYLGIDHSKLQHLLPEEIESVFEIRKVPKGEQLKDLARLLKELMTKYPADQIRIVSPLRSTEISLYKLFEGGSEIFSNEVRKMMPLLKNLDAEGQIGWRSVSKFKGMEADAVIVIDLDDDTEAKLAREGKTLLDQLYVGMTRARFALYLITSDSFQKP
jgi:hypothetical protein